MMMDRHDYAREMAVIQSLIDLEARLPEKVFCAPLAGLWVIDIDEVFTRGFFDRCQLLTIAGGSESFVFAVLEPHPEKYFFKNFGTYPLLRFTPSHNSEDYVATLQEAPGGSGADALLYNSDVIAVYPDDHSWLLYGDRNFELGVVGAFGDSVAAMVEARPPARLFNVQDAITQLLPPVFHGAVPAEVQRSLLQNYGGSSEVRRP